MVKYKMASHCYHNQTWNEKYLLIWASQLASHIIFENDTSQAGRITVDPSLYKLYSEYVF